MDDPVQAFIDGLVSKQYNENIAAAQAAQGKAASYLHEIQNPVQDDWGTAIMKALVTAAPALIGGAVGGVRGAEAGAEGGVTTGKLIAEKDAEDRKRKQDTNTLLYKNEADKADLYSKAAIEAKERGVTMKGQQLSEDRRDDRQTRALTAQAEQSDRRFGAMMAGLNASREGREDGRAQSQRNKITDRWDRSLSPQLTKQADAIGELEGLVAGNSNITSQMAKNALVRAAGNYPVSDYDIRNTVPESMRSKVVAIQNWLDSGTTDPLAPEQKAALGTYIDIVKKKLGERFVAKKKELRGWALKNAKDVPPEEVNDLVDELGGSLESVFGGAGGGGANPPSGKTYRVNVGAGPQDLTYDQLTQFFSPEDLAKKGITQ